MGREKLEEPEYYRDSSSGKIYVLRYVVMSEGKAVYYELENVFETAEPWSMRPDNFTVWARMERLTEMEVLALATR